MQALAFVNRGQDSLWEPFEPRVRRMAVKVIHQVILLFMWKKNLSLSQHVSVEYIHWQDLYTDICAPKSERYWWVCHRLSTGLQPNVSMTDCVCIKMQLNPFHSMNDTRSDRAIWQEVIEPVVFASQLPCGTILAFLGAMGSRSRRLVGICTEQALFPYLHGFFRWPW